MSTNGNAAAPGVNGRAYTYEDHKFDVVVVGAGGAGLRATLGMAEQGLLPGVLTRVLPKRRTPWVAMVARCRRPPP